MWRRPMATIEAKEQCDFKDPLPYAPGPRILIARHGDTPWNGKKGASNNRVRGQADLPMTAKGHKESKMSAEILAKTGIRYVFTCPLQRTRQTGSDIAKASGDVETAPARGLLPWDM